MMKEPSNPYMTDELKGLTKDQLRDLFIGAWEEDGLRRECYVYIAGPLFSSGDPNENLKQALFIGTKVWNAGGIPFIPHLNLIWEREFPREPRECMLYDFAWLQRCDLFYWDKELFGDAPSAGAEAEEEVAKMMGLFCVYDWDGAEENIKSFNRWASSSKESLDGKSKGEDHDHDGEHDEDPDD